MRMAEAWHPACAPPPAAAPLGLSMIVQHHEQIEAAFAAVKAATTPGARVAAQKKLAIILTLGLLESISPMTQDYLDKLEHIRGAVAHHSL